MTPKFLYCGVFAHEEELLLELPPKDLPVLNPAHGVLRTQAYGIILFINIIFLQDKLLFQRYKKFYSYSAKLQHFNEFNACKKSQSRVLC